MTTLELISIIIGSLAVIMVIIQLMYPTLPKYIGCPIIGVLLTALALLLMPTYANWWVVSLTAVIILVIFSGIGTLSWQSRGNTVKPTSTSVEVSISMQEQHYHKIAELVLKLKRKVMY